MRVAGDPLSEHLTATGADRSSVIVNSLACEPEGATMTEQSAERRPIGWWLKTADARIEQAFEDVFESQSISRREWQVLEPVSRGSVLEHELLQKLEAFAGAQDAVDELRRRGLLSDGADGALLLTAEGQVAHGEASAGVARGRPQ